MKSSPAASVILPVHNAQRYVLEAIESVLAQTFRDFELLLLDDGSTDDSPKILASAAARDPRCRVYSWPARGLVTTLNEGMRLAQGEFIVRMDADDICRPERFEQQIQYLRDHAECVAVGSRVVFIDPDGMPLLEAIDCFTHEDIDRTLLTRRLGVVHPTAVIRKQAMLTIGGYRSQYTHAEDLDLFIRLAEVGQLANLPNVLLEYRQHGQSVSHLYQDKQYESACQVIVDAYGRRGLVWEKSGSDIAPKSEPVSLADVHRKWAWWALAIGNVSTARKHAFKALWHAPQSPANWLIVAYALRGY